ncbi:MAG TPA: PadR family transcriptional regulator [Vicinamibacterales bacterium]|nr:PadR family transcriptional regulator [Vicinamibacterales bacterium]
MPSKPLSAVAVLVLSSLAEADRHGYNIKKDVKARSGGEVAPGATSLYRTLWQLLDDGLIAESPRRPAPQHDDERRRYFQITSAGRKALAAERARLERLVAAARPRRYASSTPRS